MRISTVKKRIEKMGFGPLMFENCDKDSSKCVRISAEDTVKEFCKELNMELDVSAADYYGEFRGNYPWIDPRLVKLAKEAGSYWEWENPGAICLYLD